MALLDRHKILETNATLLLVSSLLVVSIGGIVQIVPLFYIENTIEDVEGMRPYTPLELAGREIFIREGCYVCHSQMIRPMRDEFERYGHYSLAAESMYDHPLATHRMVRVPYSDDMIANARADFQAQIDPASDGYEALVARYVADPDPDDGTDPRNTVVASNPDGLPGISEMDALIVYLQMLGTLVDFSTFTPDPNR